MGGCCSSTKQKGNNENKKRPLGKLEYKNKKQYESLEIQGPEAEINELFDLMKDEEGNITSQQCKEIIESLGEKFSQAELEAMLLKIE